MQNKKAILAQAGLANVQGPGHQPGATAPISNDLLSMSSTLNGLNGLSFVPSSSSSSSSSSGSSTPFLAESATFGQYPNFSTSSSSSANMTSSGSSNINTYFQSLTGGLYNNQSHSSQKPTSLEDQAAAAMSFFNTDQLIKFASGAGGASEQLSVEKSDFALSALTDESVGRVAFEFKLNDEVIKDFPLNMPGDKSK